MVEKLCQKQDIRLSTPKLAIRSQLPKNVGASRMFQAQVTRSTVILFSDTLHSNP